MQRAVNRQRRLDREEARKSVAGSGSRRIDGGGVVTVMVRMAGRLMVSGMRIAAISHDREMKDAHRAEQDDEAKAKEFAGREPMHEIRYKSGFRNCHHSSAN